MFAKNQSLFPVGRFSTGRNSRGWTIVVLLIGVLIVLILYVTYFKSQSTTMQPGGNAIDQALDEATQQLDNAEGVDPANKDATPAPNKYQSSMANQFMAIDRARAVQQVGNQKAISENLMMWKITHPELEVTMENLQKTNFQFPPLKPHLEYYIVDDAIRVREK